MVVGRLARVHRRAAFTSVLDGIPGVGPKRKRALLRRFGSVERIKEASTDELVAATGIPEHGDPQYMWTVAERSYNMERAFNIREGFGRKDDSLPQRFLTEELQKGLAEGQRVRKQDTCLDQYYDLRGWDRNGIPTKETLVSLGLKELDRDITKFRR